MKTFRRSVSADVSTWKKNKKDPVDLFLWPVDSDVT